MNARVALCVQPYQQDVLLCLQLLREVNSLALRELLGAETMERPEC